VYVLNYVARVFLFEDFHRGAFARKDIADHYDPDPNFQNMLQSISLILLSLLAPFFYLLSKNLSNKFHNDNPMMLPQSWQYKYPHSFNDLRHSCSLTFVKNACKLYYADECPQPEFIQFEVEP
jgi:hypothetical protein